MDLFISFVTHNWMLIIALVVILVMLFFNLFGSRLRGYHPVGPADTVNLINHENAIVLDVRENKEYQGGHIPEAIHIPLSQLPGRVSELRKYKDCPVIAYCRSGNRSNSAGGVLKKNGFEKVYNLRGGIVGWEKASLPVSTK